MTPEDEIGVANVITWDKVLVVFRSSALAGGLLIVEGVFQRVCDIGHLVAARLEYLPLWSYLLSLEIEMSRISCASRATGA